VQTVEAITTEFLATWDMVLDAPIPIGHGPLGTRYIMRVTSGKIDGPRLKGETMAMTGDWMLLRDDGVGELDVRSSIKTDDGEFIYMHYHGLMHARPEIMQAAFSGQEIAPTDLYFRMAAFFETGSAKYGWLNKVLTVGNGQVGLPRLLAALFVVK
jgi:hypothetical protein